MSPKQLLRAAVRRAGFEFRKVGAPIAPFIPYLKHYDLDYGAERRCALISGLQTRTLTNGTMNGFTLQMTQFGSYISSVTSFDQEIMSLRLAAITAS